MAAPAPSDRELMEAHHAGDDRAFNEIIRRHQQRMWAVALRILGDPDEAGDAVQEACVSAFRGAAKFRADAALSTWLHQIVVNACLMRIRSRRPLVALPEFDTMDVAAPGDAYADWELRLDIDAALARLPQDQRVAIVLVDIEGFAVAEAAQLLGVPAGTVKTRCMRGRLRLAVMLGHLRGGAAPPGRRWATPARLDTGVARKPDGGEGS